MRRATITIGDDIEVTIVDIRGDKVRLGIIAPKEISVDRKEIHEKKKQTAGGGPIRTASSAISTWSASRSASE